MARYSSGILTAAGSATLPIFSVYAIASRRGILREIGIFNTTATAVALNLQRLTTTGTKPAALTEGLWNNDGPPGGMTFHGTHTVAPTLGDDLGFRVVLGAAIGSGVIWTFGDEGIVIPAGTANGVGVIVENGTGQACQGYAVWGE